MPAGMDEEVVDQTETTVEGAETEPSTETTPPAEEHEDPAEALRAMREDTDRLREEAKFFRTAAMRSQQASQKKPLVEKDPNDYLTAGDVKGIDDRFSSIEDRLRSQHEHNCEVAARAKYSDFDDVVMKYTLPMVEAETKAGRRSLMDAIDKADDPAMAAYMFGRTSEQYLADRSKEASKKVVSKIEQNLQKPGTLGAVKGGKPEATEKSPKDMTPEEFRAYRQAKVGF